MKKLRVAFFLGRSGEHDNLAASAASVFKQLIE